MDSEAFLRQVGAVALLSARQEVDLALCMRSGAAAARELTDTVVSDERRAELQDLVDSGDAAREQMVQANLRLVVSVARRFVRSGVPLLDLVQDGTVGLIQAVDRFDPDRGCRFSTYAMWWIRQAINRGSAEAARQVRLPRSVQQQLSNCHARRLELTAQLGREPNRQELAAACGLSVAETVSLLQADPQPLSLDMSGADESDDVADRHGIDPVDVAARSVGVHRLQWAMQRLEPLEMEVLSLRYGFTGPPQGCTAVAEALDLSRDRVRAIEARALRTLGSAPGMADLAEGPPRARPAPEPGHDGPMWSRKPSLPADVKASMTLARGERILAAAMDDSGSWLAGSVRALHLGSATGWTVLAWERVDRAAWDRDTERLEVVEVAEFGQPQPRHLHQISDPGRLLELVHERVTASVVITRHVPVEGSRGLRIVGRRAPGTADPVVWSALLDDALDPDDPRVVEALEQGLEQARREVTGTPQ